MTQPSIQSSNGETTFTTGGSPRIEIYTSLFCGYCRRAKALLDHKGVTYEEFDVMMDPALRGEMTRRAIGKTSVPQIFIDGENVGGSDELYALEMAGGLDVKLGRRPSTAQHV